MNFHKRLVFLGMIAWRAKATGIEALGYTLDEYENASKLDFLGEIKGIGRLFTRKFDSVGPNSGQTEEN